MSLLSTIGKAFSTLGDSATGGLFSLGTSLLSGIANKSAQKSANETNIQLARESNDLQRELADKNNQFQLDAMRENNEFNKQAAIDMFNLENEYNDPTKQIERLNNAGINPAVALGGNGVSMVNSGDGMTPSASGSGISPQLPSMVTPQVQKEPPVISGVMDTLSQFSQIMLNRKKAGESEANTKRTYTLMDAELKEILAKYKQHEAETAYTELQTFLDMVFEPFQRNAKIQETGANIKQLVANAAMAAAKEQTEKSMKLYYDAETALSKVKNDQIKEQAPLILQQLRENIRLIQEQQQTEKSKQADNYAGASMKRNQSRIYDVAATLDELKRDWLTDRQNNEYGFPTQSRLEQIFNYDFRQQVSNLAKTDKECKQLDAAIEKLFNEAAKGKKELDWFEVDRVFNMAMGVTDRVTNLVSFWKPKLSNVSATTHNTSESYSESHVHSYKED